MAESGNQLTDIIFLVFNACDLETIVFKRTNKKNFEKQN